MPPWTYTFNPICLWGRQIVWFVLVFDVLSLHYHFQTQLFVFKDLHNLVELMQTMFFVTGLVGPGMLDGSVSGSVFASPATGQVLYAIAQLYKYHSGILRFSNFMNRKKENIFIWLTQMTAQKKKETNWKKKK